MKKLNIILVVLILFLTFTLTGFCTWYLPVIHLDSGNTWDDETLIYDGLDATAGSTEVAKSTWSDFIILDTYSEIHSEKIKFLAYYKGATGIQEIDIDLYYNSQWNDLYEGVFDDQVWTEIDVIPSQSLTAARVRFYAKKADTAYFYGFEFLNPDINMGGTATNRGTTSADAIRTYIDKNNPANASGTITSIEIYVNSALLNVRFAIFTENPADTFTTRSDVFVGDVGTGLRQFDVSLVVEEGDFIGLSYQSGRIEKDNFGAGHWYAASFAIPCTGQFFIPFTNTTFSLYGTGVTVVPTYNYYGHFIK